MGDLAINKQLSFGRWRRSYVDGGHVQPAGKATRNHDGFDVVAGVLFRVSAIVEDGVRHVIQRPLTYPGLTR
jgi:hypothetical protein